MHELNLLPPVRRQQLQQESALVNISRLIRRIIIAFAVLTLVGVTAAVFFVVTSGATPQTVALKESLSQYQQLRRDINSQNARLTAITQLTRQRITWSDVIGKLLGSLPPGVTLQQITADSTNSRLLIIGQASSRDVLVTLDQQLRSAAWISHVDAPADNLLERTNPSFTFTLTLAP